MENILEKRHNLRAAIRITLALDLLIYSISMYWRVRKAIWYIEYQDLADEVDFPPFHLKKKKQGQMLIALWSTFLALKIIIGIPFILGTGASRNETNPKLSIRLLYTALGLLLVTFGSLASFWIYQSELERGVEEKYWREGLAGYTLLVIVVVTILTIWLVKLLRVVVDAESLQKYYDQYKSQSQRKRRRTFALDDDADDDEFANMFDYTEDQSLSESIPSGTDSRKSEQQMEGHDDFQIKSNHDGKRRTRTSQLQQLQRLRHHHSGQVGVGVVGKDHHRHSETQKIKRSYPSFPDAELPHRPSLTAAQIGAIPRERLSQQISPTEPGQPPPSGDNTQASTPVGVEEHEHHHDHHPIHKHRHGRHGHGHGHHHGH